MNKPALKEIFDKQKQGFSKDQAQENLEDILQVVGFMVGDEEFGVPILNVLEIVKPIDFTRVPGTPSYVLGVFNLRGNVLPLINLRLKFNLPAIKPDKDTCYLVIKHEDMVAGFVIDKLTGALRLKHSQIDPIPETINAQEDLMFGVGKQDGRLITILKTQNLLKKTF